MIDTAVRELIDAAFAATIAILHKRRKPLGMAAADLLQKETLNGEDLRRQYQTKIRGPSCKR